MDIKDATIGDLQIELKRRKETPPLIIDLHNINHVKLGNLMSACDDYIKYLAGDYYPSEADSYRDDIFEKAISIFYGDDIWTWINSFDD